MGIQELINSGMAWRLEGSVGRECMRWIESGAAILGPQGVYDYYGNYVPSRTEVKRGTKGSIKYANDCMGTNFRGRDFDNGRVERYVNERYED